jgi:hypothetical protein
MVQAALRFGCNTGVLIASDEAWSGVPADRRDSSRIIVWWTDDQTGQLLTMLAWMCTRDSVWERADIRVYVASTDPAEAERVSALLDEARLPVQVGGIADPGAFVSLANDCDLFFGPMRVRRGEIFGPGDSNIDSFAASFPVALLVQAAAPIELDVQPDDGEIAALAIARDRALKSAARAEELDRAASQLIVDAEMARLTLTTDAEVEQAAHTAAAAHRQYLDARARADEAWRIVRELDPTETDQVDEQLWIEHVADRQ